MKDLMIMMWQFILKGPDVQISAHSSMTLCVEVMETRMETDASLRQKYAEIIIIWKWLTRVIKFCKTPE